MIEINKIVNYLFLIKFVITLSPVKPRINPPVNPINPIIILYDLSLPPYKFVNILYIIFDEMNPAEDHTIVFNTRIYYK